LLSFVKGPFTETALDIAGGTHRQVQPSVGHIRFPGKAGMPGTDMRKLLVNFDGT
jgi:hypothetical protein